MTKASDYTPQDRVIALKGAVLEFTRKYSEVIFG